MKRISLLEVEYIAFRLAKKRWGKYQPIPLFSTRLPNKLESSIITPFQNVYGKEAYPGLISKAAILFYLMNKNHPFQNGNKRIAMMTLLLFLSKNQKWLRVNDLKFYEFARKTADSKAEGKDKVVNTIQKFIKNHLVDLER